MRIVQSKNEDVVRIWANQEQERSETRHLAHRGMRLINYGTLIGLMVDNKRGRYALVTSVKYSDTTTVICNLAAKAGKNEALNCFRVPNLGGERADITANLRHYEAEIAELIDKLKRGRASSIVFYRQRIKEAIAEAHSYSVAFGRSWRWKGENCDAIRQGEEA